MFSVRGFGYFRIFCAFAFLQLAAPTAQAMSVTPLSMELTASGATNKSTLRVHNDGAVPIPVEIQISRITLNEEGESQSDPAAGQFLLFPAQAIIPAGASQSFRVQWLGAPDLKESQTFIFSVNQLPVDLGASKSGVQIVFNFSVIVNVAPQAGQSLLKLVSSNLVADGKGAKRTVIRVQNAGNRYALLGDGAVVLSSGTWSKTITGGELRQMIGLGLVQPGRTRKFSLSAEIPLQITKVDARVEYASTSTSN
ncbi:MULTISPECIES: fimbria/pilus periplasmic chaperone [Rhodomicrobium]|uniref:fimbrial biogenesis chaperone n=1 Tax=Rhodomicrobium TaxID=1068 RepID=UPI0014835279|nr:MULTISPECIES: fimbria/pilus periplasmic chaperone [Rhodomicrobium]